MSHLGCLESGKLMNLSGLARALLKNIFTHQKRLGVIICVKQRHSKSLCMNDASFFSRVDDDAKSSLLIYFRLAACSPPDFLISWHEEKEDNQLLNVILMRLFNLLFGGKNIIEKSRELCACIFYHNEIKAINHQDPV